MQAYKWFLPLAGGLISFMCLVGITSEAIADRDDDKRNGVQRLTICHVETAVTGDDDKGSKTLTLPAHVAQRHLQLHTNDFTRECR